MDTPYLSSDPHAGQPVHRLGQPRQRRLAVVLCRARSGAGISWRYTHDDLPGP